ncbi:MAG TPA: hypothetical protein VHU91_08185 [Mycobacteriales bacterium]|jgi:hypothetical protein|nr:hypothetical protein [Mycobacteriales bacterium]
MTITQSLHGELSIPVGSPAVTATVWLEGFSCAECRRSWVHCHSALVVHATGESECTDHACGLDAEAHGELVACEELVPPCTCL